MMLEMTNVGQWALQGLSVKLGIYSLKLNNRFMQVKPLLFTWRVLTIFTRIMDAKFKSTMPTHQNERC